MESFEYDFLVFFDFFCIFWYWWYIFLNEIWFGCLLKLIFIGGKIEFVMIVICLGIWVINCEDLEGRFCNVGKDDGLEIV